MFIDTIQIYDFLFMTNILKETWSTCSRNFYPSEAPEFNTGLVGYVSICILYHVVDYSMSSLSSGHCIVCSSIYDFWLPFDIFNGLLFSFNMIKI